MMNERRNTFILALTALLSGGSCSSEKNEADSPTKSETSYPTREEWQKQATQSINKKNADEAMKQLQAEIQADTKAAKKK